MQTNSFRLDDRVAIVTGAGTGMGREFSLALANAGADVVVTELPGKEALAEETASVIRSAGRRCLVLPLDVTSRPMIEEMVQHVVDEWGHVDILVNNAGINVRSMAIDVKEQDWDAIIDTDLKGAFFCAQAVGRHMIERGKGGKIISIASQLAIVAYPSRVVYCAAKAGVASFTRALALEWAPHHINVNSVAPTFVNTPFVAKLLEDEAVNEDVVRRIPWGRVAEPEDIAGSVVFLASPASDFITGHTLVVDGGWTIV